uniref:Uncharacterized protein n=1 Tax=Oryza meridionalis TaxID=40149 RepID=A0A0E0BY28_9ORYZ
MVSAVLAGRIQLWRWHRRLTLANSPEVAAAVIPMGGSVGDFFGEWIRRFSTPSFSPPAPKLLPRWQRWHRRSLEQIQWRWWQRRFRWADLAVLYPLPLHPKLLPWIWRRRRLLPWIQRRRQRQRHPRADPAEGICPPPPKSPR